ncbi:sulfur carrier protein ThiS [Psychromarinibacter sp. C21-152]|uniref:Sulfur carrier protein ThiS n=1 Tax=Psychromarinibacter sediminicola TaxID=3033385 RepID=A0AAE3NR69_9RHOB|nr:sulfur carrier protein ThiS [Psychromarinibacter sediminicola]MDF0600551.1 sulfur carrier protein ThiS [Psychromarinibacter sediminicola]
MKITVNGTPTDIAATDLAAALEELGYGEARVATAVNETFVPAAARGHQALAAGDRLEILAPKQGG